MRDVIDATLGEAIEAARGESVYYQQIPEDGGESPQTAAVAADMGPSAPAAMAPPVGQRRQPGRPAQTAPPRQPQLAIDIAVHVSIDDLADVAVDVVTVGRAPGLCIPP